MVSGQLGLINLKKHTVLSLFNLTIYYQSLIYWTESIVKKSLNRQRFYVMNPNPDEKKNTIISIESINLRFYNFLSSVSLVVPVILFAYFYCNLI